MMQEALMQEAALLEHLECRGADGWAPLPEWARFMLRAGAAAATIQPDAGRLVIALSVPTRAFAAALAATSAVATAFRETPSDRDGAAHFRYLSSQAAGTPVTHRRDNSLEQGTLLGIQEDDAGDGKPRLVVQLAKEKILLPEELCERIQVITNPGELTSRRKQLVKAPEFLARALKEADIPSLSGTTRVDCVIVGVKRLLEYELATERFAVSDGGRLYEGHLQSIVRAREFAGQNDPFRCSVIPASAEGDGQPLDSAPTTVIFDGVAAFNNWRSAWPSSNWLVIIDRSSPSADDGAAAINQAHAMRAAEADELRELSVPAGVEMLTYVDRR